MLISRQLTNNTQRGLVMKLIYFLLFCLTSTAALADHNPSIELVLKKLGRAQQQINEAQDTIAVAQETIANAQEDLMIILTNSQAQPVMVERTVTTDQTTCSNWIGRHATYRYQANVRNTQLQMIQEIAHKCLATPDCDVNDANQRNVQFTFLFEAPNQCTITARL